MELVLILEPLWVYRAGSRGCTLCARRLRITGAKLAIQDLNNKVSPLLKGLWISAIEADTICSINLSFSTCNTFFCTVWVKRGQAGLQEKGSGGGQSDRLGDWGGSPTSWPDPHVLLAVQHEAAHGLALGTVGRSLAH